MLVLDVAMPGMSGAECYQEIRRLDPLIPIVMASGFAKGHDIQSLLEHPRLRKPYEFDDMAKILSEPAEGSELSLPVPRQLSLHPASRPQPGV